MKLYRVVVRDCDGRLVTIDTTTNPVDIDGLYKIISTYDSDTDTFVKGEVL